MNNSEIFKYMALMFLNNAKKNWKRRNSNDTVNTVILTNL